MRNMACNKCTWILPSCLLLVILVKSVIERPLNIPEVVDIQKVFSLAANKGDISSYNFLPLGRSAGTPGFWRNGTEANSAMCSWNQWGEWSDGPCSVTCGEGAMVVSRTRICSAPDSASCPGQRVDKKMVNCSKGTGCGDLECYECNVHQHGRSASCKDPKLLTNCRGCMKIFTKVRHHDRVGYTKDLVAVSRLCIQQRDTNIWEEEECIHTRNNGGYTVMCQCFSDRCNIGVRQGDMLSPCLFIGIVYFVFFIGFEQF